jgi:2,3-bisphosphoglycerate-independent phosphoglycerate mutase
MAKRTVVLVVLDGWGIGQPDESNPIHVVNPQTFVRLAQEYPMTSLQASGIAVGLPWGEVGNSEVGHLTLGAGKVLYQYFPKITMAIQDKTFYQNKVFLDAIAHAKQNSGALNLAGLLTKANVHASLDHLLALIRLAEQEGVTNINLHLFADGKDSPPHTLQAFLKEIPEKYLATLTGRYYAMDRNGNWQLTQSAYQVMTGQAGKLAADSAALAGIIEETYQQKLTEEYLPPIKITAGAADGAAVNEKNVKNGDALIFFNYREDSIRELAAAFITKNFDKFPVLQFNDLFIATMSHYDDSFDVPVAFPADRVDDPIGKVFSDNGMAQLRLAETYKYAHVTYFFNGLREEPFPGEYRTLIPSVSAIHAEEHPEMMASAITDRLIEAIQNKSFDFILVNYANPDAIAHTADYVASLEAVRVIDREIARVLAVVEKTDAFLVITSDHGNVEEMIDRATGLPESQHDPSPVPLYLVGSEFKGKSFPPGRLDIETLGSLADVAPTILEAIGIQKPAEMSGRSLLDELA